MMLKLEIPSVVTLFTENAKCQLQAAETMQFEDIRITLKCRDRQLQIRLTAEDSPVTFLRLHWAMPLPAKALFLGDAWERTYGDIQWRTHAPERMMPWYFLMNHEDLTAGFGVKVRPSAFAMWSESPEGITLWLDFRSGTKGVRLDGRTLDAVTVISAEFPESSPWEAAGSFCREMCTDPLLPPVPVYGGNNWYYAYGISSHEEILNDSRYIASLCKGLKNPPFMVIDDGWQIRHGQPENSGPWNAGNSRYPDMARLADEMRSCGVRPGIWMRPLWNLDPRIPESWLLQAKENSDRRYLDPSRPEVLDWVRNDIRRLSGWGYELIKHDFTTFDIFGKWAFEANPLLAVGSWSFADSSRTTAEIIISLYRAILEAADGALILGCNTIGHLGAGLMHLARTGDDTSGGRWGRTRKMGVNTLAFRLCQHRSFYDADADCVGITGEIPWSLNRQWSELLAKSGTAFFASIRPGILTAAEFAEMQEFFALASKQDSAAEPLDWMYDSTPAVWRLGREEKRFHWHENTPGDLPDFIG